MDLRWSLVLALTTLAVLGPARVAAQDGVPGFESFLRGQVLQLPDDTFVLQPLDPLSSAIKLKTTPSLGKALTRLPQVTFGDTELTIFGNSITIPDAQVGLAQLPSVAQYKEFQNDPSAGLTQFDGLNAAFSELAKVTDLPLSFQSGFPQSDPDQLRSRVLDAAEAVSTTTIDILASTSYATPSVMGAEVDKMLQLVELLQAEIDVLEPKENIDFNNRSAFEKAIYANTREYLPFVYRHIAANTQGAVGIGQKLGIGDGDSKVFCSGAIIGPNLVLTARHCLYSKLQGQETERPISGLRVVFDYESDPAIQMERKEARISRVVAVGEMPDSDPASQLDYALLEVEDTPPPTVFWTPAPLLKSDGPSMPGRQVCLSTVNLNRDDEIYVIGHPRGAPRAVADNGKVLFPYRLDKAALGILSLKVLKEIKSDTSSEAADPARLAELLEKWKDSYLLTEDGYYIHNSRQFRGQPTLGIQSQTFGGNSGGPVFSKLYNQVVGVFRGGQYDGGVELDGNWEFHESALPVEAVIKDMNIREPTWMETLKVCAWGYNNDSFALWSRDTSLLKHCERACR